MSTEGPSSILLEKQEVSNFIVANQKTSIFHSNYSQNRRIRCK